MRCFAVSAPLSSADFYPASNGHSDKNVTQIPPESGNSTVTEGSQIEVDEAMPVVDDPALDYPSDVLGKQFKCNFS